MELSIVYLIPASIISGIIITAYLLGKEVGRDEATREARNG